MALLQCLVKMLLITRKLHVARFKPVPHMHTPLSSNLPQLSWGRVSAQAIMTVGLQEYNVILRCVLVVMSECVLTFDPSVDCLCSLVAENATTLPPRRRIQLLSHQVLRSQLPPLPRRAVEQARIVGIVHVLSSITRVQTQGATENYKTHKIQRFS